MLITSLVSRSLCVNCILFFCAPLKIQRSDVCARKGALLHASNLKAPLLSPDVIVLLNALGRPLASDVTGIVDPGVSRGILPATLIDSSIKQI